MADIFDALSMRRPYQEPWPLPQILTELERSADQHLDARIATSFVQSLAQVLGVQAEWNARCELGM